MSSAVVGEVVEPEADSFDAFYEPVDGLGGAVGDPAGGEVGEQLVGPGGDGAAQPLQLGDPGIGAGPVEPLQPSAVLVQVGGRVHMPQLLGGDVGGGDMSVRVAVVQPGQQPGA